MKRTSSSQPANSLFRNDPKTRRTERAILRPIDLKALGISGEDQVFVFRYYRDMAAGRASSCERVMFVSFEDLKEFSRRTPPDIVDVKALSALVMVDEFMEDEGDAMERVLIRAIARQRWG